MPAPLKLYEMMTRHTKWLFKLGLKLRVSKGKEDPERLCERMGTASEKRPSGHLIWFHAASVGEAQSCLILIKTFRENFPGIQCLITTGTKSSAELMKKRMPDWALHQYYPVDHPDWVCEFLDHWRPDLAIWVESEIWPNMLCEIKKRQLPVALVNARMSRQSFRRWRYFPKTAKQLLDTFDLFLAQTKEDEQTFRALGAGKVVVTDSLKYAADPLPVDKNMLNKFDSRLETRIGWLYASTHNGEEEIAFEIHKELKENFPTLLTIIAPRDIKRANEIRNLAQSKDLKIHIKSENDAAPDPETDIFLVDTFGEMGLFYQLSGLACIGRSFSKDGGGGHNPIEAAQLKCAVLHGPNIQNFSKVYQEMNEDKAALRCETPEELKHNLARLFFNPENVFHLQTSAYEFVCSRAKVLEHIMQELEGLFIESGLNCIPPEDRPSKVACV